MPKRVSVKGKGADLFFGDYSRRPRLPNRLPAPRRSAEWRRLSEPATSLDAMPYRSSQRRHRLLTLHRAPPAAPTKAPPRAAACKSTDTAPLSERAASSAR